MQNSGIWVEDHIDDAGRYCLVFLIDHCVADIRQGPDGRWSLTWVVGDERLNHHEAPFADKDRAVACVKAILRTEPSL
jgi:hypothetical protein